MLIKPKEWSNFISTSVVDESLKSKKSSATYLHENKFLQKIKGRGKGFVKLTSRVNWVKCNKYAT